MNIGVSPRPTAGEEAEKRTHGGSSRRGSTRGITRESAWIVRVDLGSTRTDSSSLSDQTIKVKVKVKGTRVFVECSEMSKDAVCAMSSPEWME